MLEEIIKSLWLFLPAAIANMSASLSRFIPILNFPLDFKIKYKGKRLFGKNKTFRGLIVGTFFGAVSASIMYSIWQEGFSLVNYSGNFLLYGALLGFGALLGDSIESFFKRQKNISPGKPWIPFDQIDWILGAYILSIAIVNIPLFSFIITLVIFGSMHPIINYLGYLLKLQKNKL